jgi:tetratricopeptide (TPR) repeat protein
MGRQRTIRMTKHCICMSRMSLLKYDGIMTLSQGLLDKLNAALVDRRIADGFQLLARAEKELEALQPTDPHAAAYLLCIAQWVDLGFRNVDYLNGIAARFVDVRRGRMPICDYLYLRMVEGHLAFLAEDAEAISIFSFVLQTETTIMEPYLVVVAHFWKCRAHRRQGEYEPALHHIREAKRLAREMKAPKLVAVTNIHESWLLFQRGERREAMRLLDLAESELKSTGHALSLGNIESARGRFVRRSGEYTKALAHFEKAVAIYSGAVPDHPNLARALVNAAYVKRLIALDLLHRSKSGRARGADHARYLEICQDALALLARAGEIYSRQHHHSGTGSVLVNAGHLHLDSGDIDRAEGEAAKAYRLGEERQDHILMARSRILQSTVQNERVEEQVGESADLSLHGHLARTYSEDAITLAKLTQNNRLLAGAYIARSSVAANEFFQDWETAKTFAALAGELLGKDDLDHLSKELIVLKARIIRATGVDEMLRAWSEGITGEKTFQEVTEEFAELVIPKVWIREGKKVSRVAERLSISPKKVRRILANVDLLKRQ